MGARSTKEVTETTIKKYFEKCRVVKNNDDFIEVEEDDLEFESLVRELNLSTSVAEYVYFVADTQTSERMINEHEVHRRERSQEDCINAIITQSNESDETQEV